MTEAQAIPDRFVFLDRDGVINLDFGEYTTTIDEWKWAPGAVEGIKMLTDAGFGIIVITNQACIAKGIQTEEGLALLHTFMLNHIRESGGNILKIYLAFQLLLFSLNFHHLRLFCAIRSKFFFLYLLSMQIVPF